MRFTKDGKYLVAGGEKGLLQVYSRAHLQIVHTYACK